MLRSVDMQMDNDASLEIFKLQAELCKSLADPKRLMLIHELRHGSKSVAELAEALGLKQSNTSQHLAVLRRAGIVMTQRDGSTIYYSLVTAKIAMACDTVREVIAEKLGRDQVLIDSISNS